MQRPQGKSRPTSMPVLFCICICFLLSLCCFQPVSAFEPFQSDYYDDEDVHVLESGSDGSDGSDGMSLHSVDSKNAKNANDNNVKANQEKQKQEQQEDVTSYRLRNHIPFHYQPQNIHEELCKFLTEAECEDLDHAFYSNAHHAQDVASQGIMATLVLLVQWKEDPKPMLPFQGFHELWNSEQVHGDYTPSGSIKSYIDINSYGKLAVEATIVDWITINGTENYYSSLPYMSIQEPDVRGAWHYALEQLDNTGFDFAPFDLDNDGILDNVAFMHSGYGAENGNSPCADENSIARQRINSHATSGEPYSTWHSKDGKYQLGNFAVNTAYRGRCTGNLARLNVITHEFLHTIGLPDMYGHCGIWSGMGAYDIMGKSNGVTGRPAWPPMLSPWSKYQLGWSQPTEITEDGTYIARPSAHYDDIFVIKQGYAQNEYLMIENRQPVEWEKDLWNHGVLIYHVDENPPAGRNNRGWGWQDRGFPGLPFAEWPSSGEHYKVALLAADGNYDLEKCDNHGNSEDFFYRQDQVLGPGNGELIAERLHGGLYPNTDSYAGGNIVVTGISISNFRKLSSGAFSFDVSGLGDGSGDNEGNGSLTMPPQPEPTRSPTASPTKPPTKRPSSSPSRRPTPPPTDPPTKSPTRTPTTSSPTKRPTRNPTRSPTQNPSPNPTLRPTRSPTRRPVADPTHRPTTSPTRLPTTSPSKNPTSATGESEIDAVTDDPPFYLAVDPESGPNWLGIEIGFDSDLAVIDFTDTKVDISDDNINVEKGGSSWRVVMQFGNRLILRRRDWVSVSQPGMLLFKIKGPVDSITTLFDKPPLVRPT